MDIEAERALRGMLRTGTVASVNVANNTARVRFDDKDGVASPELHILHRCSGKNKDYWVPDVGDQVLCIFNNNDANFSTGWIMGSYFTEKQPPQVASEDIMRMDFAGGSFIEVDRAAGSLKINFTGPITINGSTINLN